MVWNKNIGIKYYENHFTSDIAIEWLILPWLVNWLTDQVMGCSHRILQVLFFERFLFIRLVLWTGSFAKNEIHYSAPYQAGKRAYQKWQKQTQVGGPWNSYIRLKKSLVFIYPPILELIPYPSFFNGKKSNVIELGQYL